MPNIHKIDPIEGAWNDLLNQVGTVEEDFEHLRSGTYYWRMIAMLDYPAEAWADPPHANSIAWLAVHMPSLVERQATGERYPRFHYRLTNEGRMLAQRFVDYEKRRSNAESL